MCVPKPTSQLNCNNFNFNKATRKEKNKEFASEYFFSRKNAKKKRNKNNKIYCKHRVRWPPMTAAAVPVLTILRHFFLSFVHSYSLSVRLSSAETRYHGIHLSTPEPRWTDFTWLATNRSKWFCNLDAFCCSWNLKFMFLASTHSAASCAIGNFDETITMACISRLLCALDWRKHRWTVIWCDSTRWIVVDFLLRQSDVNLIISINEVAIVKLGNLN